MQLSTLNRSLKHIGADPRRLPEAVDTLRKTLKQNHIKINRETHGLRSKYGHRTASDLEDVTAKKLAGLMLDPHSRPTPVNRVEKALVDNGFTADDKQAHNPYKVYSLKDTDVQVIVDSDPRGSLRRGTGALLKAAARDPELVRQLHLAA